MTGLAVILFYALWFLETNFELIGLGFAMVVAVYEGAVFKLEPLTDEAAWNKKVRIGTFLGIASIACLFAVAYFFHEVFLVHP